MATQDYYDEPTMDEEPSVMTPESWFVPHQMKGGKTTFNRGLSTNTKFRGAVAKGADSGEAMMNTRAKWSKMPLADRIAYARANNAPQEVMDALQQSAPAPAELPPRLQRMPNAPMPGPNASETAPARFAAMVGNQDAARTAGSNAVKATLAEQVMNPAATVDKAIATRQAAQAEMGITDLGGGNKVLSNKYGVGSITTMTPEQFATRRPAIINDEKGNVNVAGMKGKSTMPYKSPTAARPAPGAMAMTKPEIVTANTAAMASPETAKRLAADRARQVGAYTAKTAPLRVAAKQWMASLTPKAESKTTVAAPPPMLKRPDANAPKRNPLSFLQPT